MTKLTDITMYWLLYTYLGECISTHLQKLYVLQDKIVRIIAVVPRRTSSDLLYFELNMLKLMKLYLHAVGLCIYEYENDMLPELFKDMFIKVANVHEHDTRNATTNKL